MSSAEKIKIISTDALFGLEDSEPGDGTWQIKELQLSDTYEFQNHPFLVQDNEKMMEMVESIRENGVIVPGIARPRRNGGYEVIAGHCRRHASMLAGKNTMPFMVKDYTDAEATIIMVDSNIQREDLKPSEKAKAYKMRLDAQKQLKKEGKAPLGRSDKSLEEILGESRNTIARHIRLNYLLPELLEMVDAGRLKFLVGVELSYLELEQQEELLLFMEEEDVVPSLDNAIVLKEHSRAGEWNYAVLRYVLKNPVPAPVKVTLQSKTIQNYFPKNYTKEQIEEIIIQLLEEWKEKN